MLRPDAHNDFEVLYEHEPENGDLPLMDFPLPVVRNQSPNILALQMLAKISLVFGFFMLLIRLIAVSYPDAALILAYIVAAAFAIAFGIKWLAPERGMMEWPVWLGAAVVLVFAANRYSSDSVLSAPVPASPDPRPLLPILFPIAIVLVIIVIYLSPSVKNLLSTKTKGPLAIGAVGCLIGGRWGALAHVPESDFASWNFFAVMLLLVWWAIVVVTDQYVRFEQATNPGLAVSDAVPLLPTWGSLFPVNQSALGMIALPVSLWIGNLAFLESLHLRYANEFGLLAFIGALAAFALIGASFRSGRGAPNPIIAAWDALTFWLTYNLQRNANPNMFQCVPWFREPLIRFAVVGAAITALSMALLHLSGVHAAKGRNKSADNEASIAFWKYSTPQNYPRFIEKVELNNDAKVIYERWAVTLAKDGDAPLPSRKPVRTLGDLLYSAVLFFVGGPLLFFLLLLATQGNFIASKIAAQSAVVGDEGCNHASP